MRKEEMDPAVPFAVQVQSDHSGPVTLVGTYMCAPDQISSTLEGWSKRAQMMKGQPGCISAQMYRAIGGAGVLISIVVWESLAALRAAGANAAAGPTYISDDVIGRSVLVEKVAMPGICVA